MARSGLKVGCWRVNSSTTRRSTFFPAQRIHLGWHPLRVGENLGVPEGREEGWAQKVDPLAGCAGRRRVRPVQPARAVDRSADERGAYASLARAPATRLSPAIAARVGVM